MLTQESSDWSPMCFLFAVGEKFPLLYSVLESPVKKLSFLLYKYPPTWWFASKNANIFDSQLQFFLLRWQRSAGKGSLSFRMKLLWCSQKLTQHFRLRSTLSFRIFFRSVFWWFSVSFKWYFLYLEFCISCMFESSLHINMEQSLCQIIKAKICRAQFRRQKQGPFGPAAEFPVFVFIWGPRAGLKEVHRRQGDVLPWWQSNTLLRSPSRLPTHRIMHTPSPLVRRCFFWRPHRRGEGSGLAPSVFVMGTGAKRHGGWRERKEGSCGVGG